MIGETFMHLKVYGVPRPKLWELFLRWMNDRNHDLPSATCSWVIIFYWSWNNIPV